MLSYSLSFRRLGDVSRHLKKSIFDFNPRQLRQQQRRLFCRTDNARNGVICGKCAFHTTPPRNVPPIILLLLRPISRVVSVLVGRSFRKWWSSLTPEKRAAYVSQFKTHRKTISIFVGCITGLLAVFYASHIQETPITRRRRFILFKPEQFDTISEEMFRMNVNLHQDRILPSNHEAYQFVKTVTDKLVKGNRDIPQMIRRPWSIVVVNDPAFNAFVLPSGQIFVFTGMLRICSNEDQLGAVLGHEMAHAVLGHTAELVSYIHILDMILMVLATFIWALLPTDFTSIIVHWLTAKLKHLLLELPYSRMLESEADRVGLFMAAKSCFDVRESSAFWSKMEALQKMKLELSIEWLSTHPSHETRAANLDLLVPKALQVRLEESCPKLPRMDPRLEVATFRKWAEEEHRRRLSEIHHVTHTHP